MWEYNEGASSKECSIVKKWGEARQQRHFTDVVFHVGTKPYYTTFHAHKLVLALGSSVFEKMFYGGTPEPECPIIIQDIIPEAFENVLKYLYAEKISMRNYETAFETCKAAEKYDVLDLKKHIDDYFCANCDFYCDHTFLVVFKNAAAFNLPKTVSKYLINRIKGDNRRPYQNEDHRGLLVQEFRKLQPQAVTRILDMTLTNIPVHEVLVLLTEWGIANRNSNTPLNEILKPLVRKLNFAKIGLSEFCAFTEKYPDAFNASDALSIIWHIQKPGSHSKPKWCS
ncbi:BTB/POZ domain-containing protein 6-B, partial [Stegodyphus mimosarum]